MSLAGLTSTSSQIVGRIRLTKRRRQRRLDGFFCSLRVFGFIKFLVRRASAFFVRPNHPARSRKAFAEWRPASRFFCDKSPFDIFWLRVKAEEDSVFGVVLIFCHDCTADCEASSIWVRYVSRCPPRRVDCVWRHFGRLFPAYPEWPNTALHRNSRCPSPFKRFSHFNSFGCAPPLPPPAVGELFRWAAGILRVRSPHTPTHQPRIRSSCGFARPRGLPAVGWLV